MNHSSTFSGQFYIVDVFAESAYAGNQLAVFPPGRTYSSDEMQLIAREMHFSETTFITSEQLDDGSFPVRIFTPEEELPFAGHPTLGTAYVIRELLSDHRASEIVLHLKVGNIPVRWENLQERSVPFMTQAPPKFDKQVDPGSVKKLLGIDLSDFDADFYPQIVSTGIPFCIVPLRSIDAVKKCVPQTNLFSSLFSLSESVGIHVFSTQTEQKGNDLHARVFTGMPSIPEDPATGSANGCLAAYLIHHRYFGKDSIDIRVEQGFEMQRPSLLYLRAKKNDDDILVQVGGNVVPIASAQLFDKQP